MLQLAGHGQCMIEQLAIERHCMQVAKSMTRQSWDAIDDDDINYT